MGNTQPLACILYIYTGIDGYNKRFKIKHLFKF